MLAEHKKEAVFELFFNWLLSLTSRNIKWMLKLLVWFLQWCIYVLVQPAQELLAPLYKNANEISNIQNASKVYVTHRTCVSCFYFFALFIWISSSVVNFVALGWKPIKICMACSPWSRLLRILKLSPSKT